MYTGNVIDFHIHIGRKEDWHPWVIDYLRKREKAQQLKELGTMILRFNQMGLYSWMNY